MAGAITARHRKRQFYRLSSFNVISRELFNFRKRKKLKDISPNNGVSIWFYAYQKS